jgi:hypothetical protein
MKKFVFDKVNAEKTVIDRKQNLFDTGFMTLARN